MSWKNDWAGENGGEAEAGEDGRESGEEVEVKGVVDVVVECEEIVEYRFLVLALFLVEYLSWKFLLEYLLFFGPSFSSLDSLSFSAGVGSGGKAGGGGGVMILNDSAKKYKAGLRKPEEGGEKKIE